MKNFMKEFKAFAMRGNVMDMAIGIIIGGAFGLVIKSLIDDILLPFIQLIFNMDDSFLALSIGPIRYGNFIGAIINFVIIALVLFVVIKTMNTLKAKRKEEEKAAAPVISNEEKILKEILETLKAK